MFYYLISYDLNAPEKNYTVLQEAIKCLGSCKKMLETTWMLHTEFTLDNLYSRLLSSKGIDKNDDLLIIEVKEPNDATCIYNAPNFSPRHDSSEKAGENEITYFPNVGFLF
jgi:hypothetical protein